MMLARLCRHTKTIPGCNTIMRELPFTPVLLETFKRQFQTRVKLRLRNVTQLRLGIVNVINVRILQSHVAQRLVKLVLQVSRSHAMRAANNILKRSDTRLDESLVHILAQTSRRRSIERKITAFRAD